MSKAHELGQLGHIVNVSDGISTTVSISGIVSATSFFGDGANLTNTGASVSSGVGTQRVALTDITSGIMTTAATNSNLTYDSSTGTLSATYFSGDGANLTNTGASVSSGVGTQRVVLTDITSGIMTSASTDSGITYDSSTGTLSATYFSGDGSNLTNAGSVLSAASGTQRVVLTPQVSGALESTSTNIDLLYNSTTNTLSASNVSTSTLTGYLTGDVSGISTGFHFAAVYEIGADSGNTYYTFSGKGFDSTEQNPTINLIRGQKYIFTNNLGAHPFRIQSDPNGSVGTQYLDGLSTNDVDNGSIVWEVQHDAPSTLYYQCTAHTDMGGVINIPSGGGGGGGGVVNGKILLEEGIDDSGDLAITVGFATDPSGPKFVIGPDDGASNLYMGVGVGTAVWRSNSYDSTGSNVHIGNYVASNIPTNSTSHNRNVLIGNRTISNSLYGCSNSILIGHRVSNSINGLFNSSVIIGTEAMKNVTSSNVTSGSTVIGYQAGQGAQGNFNGSGQHVLIGYRAGGYVSSQSTYQCTYIGYQAGYGNGTYANTNDEKNTIVGAHAGEGGSGTNNTYIGAYSSYGTDQTGQRNTFVGASTGGSVNAGNFNTILGAWITGTSGSNNTMVGYDAEPSSSSNVSNEITWGNANVATLRCNVQTISSLSDRRDKTNIENIPVGLNYINALRPVKFDWARRDGSYEGKKAFGFIAQELDEVQEQFGYRDYTNLTYHSNPDRIEASPMNTYPILVKAVQELSQQNQDLLRRIEELENRLNNG